MFFRVFTSWYDDAYGESLWRITVTYRRPISPFEHPVRSYRMGRPKAWSDEHDLYGAKRPHIEHANNETCLDRYRRKAEVMGVLFVTGEILDVAAREPTGVL